jgi:hypothetical protein
MPMYCKNTRRFALVFSALVAACFAVLPRVSAAQVANEIALVTNLCSGPDCITALVFGDPGLRIGTRLEIRAQVAVGDSDEYPGCAGGVGLSVEVINRLTDDTHYIVTNPLRMEIAPRQ